MRFNLLNARSVLSIAVFASSLISTTLLAQADPNDDIQQLIDEGDVQPAIAKIRKLPLAERMAWIDSLSEARSNGNNLEQGGAGRGAGNAGGGAQADFGPLIRLIQQSISPDDWEANGGDNTIQSFASGVWIDTDGIVQARKANPAKKNITNAKDAKSTDELIVLPNVGAWQAPSKLRWVSLTKLEGRLRERLEAGKAPSASMELLGGMARIDFVAWNDETKEWLLGGPAGNFAVNQNGDLVHSELGLPPVLLEDLLTVAPHVLGKKGILGCSIDPVQERMIDVQEFLSNPKNVKKLSSAPGKFTSELAEKLGPQQVIIMGLPKDSPTGLALLVADQHMKRVGLGLEPAVRGMKDYVQIADSLDAVPGKGLVRWWFALEKQAVDVDEEGNLFALPKQTVQVMSEKEWMDASGKRQAAGDRDLAADGFAKSFTQNFDSLQKKYPVYGRLRHIFDLTVAMELIRRKSSEGLGTLADAKLQPHMTSEPEFVPTVSTHRVLASKQVVAIVSGGAIITPSEVESRTSTSIEFPKVNKLQARDSQQLNWMLEQP